MIGLINRRITIMTALVYKLSFRLRQQGSDNLFVVVGRASRAQPLQ